MARPRIPDPLDAASLLEHILARARHIHAVVVKTNPEHHIDDTMLICTFMEEIQPAIAAYRRILREKQPEKRHIPSSQTEP